MKLLEQIKIDVYRCYAIEALQQAIANLQSHDIDSCVCHIGDALNALGNIDGLRVKK